MSSLSELLPFLAPTTRPDVLQATLASLRDLSGNKEGFKLISECPQVMRALLEHVHHSKDAIVCLTNLSADKSVALKMLESKSLVDTLCRLIASKQALLADPSSMLLSNLTAAKPRQELTNLRPQAMLELLNTNSEALHYLATTLSNVSCQEEVRKSLYNDDSSLDILMTLATNTRVNLVRRGGAMGVLRNLALDPNGRDKLLQSEMDVITRLLLPLANSRFEFSDKEQEQLPIDLQYLDETHDTELDSDLRLMNLETLLQLSAIKRGREGFRERGAYLVLRELHKVEKDERVQKACENLVDVLIKTEEEIGLDDYNEVDVPQDVREKFDKEEENQRNTA